MEKNQAKGGRERVSGGRALERENIYIYIYIYIYIFFFFFFLLFDSFSDLRKSDRRFSSGLKAKFIYPTRATRGHQNLGVSSNSTR